MPAKQYEVVIKLIRNNAPCHSGHKIGDKWVFNYMTPAGMCGFAFNALYPFAVAMKTGGTFPWQPDTDVLTVSCPDVEVQNVFEIRRKLKK
jgi:uncharacterized repeat protein (TIGR04076 family)